MDDGVAVRVDVEAERQGDVGNDRLAIGVRIYKIDGTEEAFNFEAQWIGQRARG